MQPINRRHVLCGVGFGAATFTLSPLSFSQQLSIPATVKLVLPFPAGGGVDATARKIVQAMAEHLSKTFIVENKPGASGVIAARTVSMAMADGGSIFYVHSGLITVQAMGAKIDLLRELRPVVKLISSPHLLVVRADSPYRTQRDLINYIKSNPGKLSFGSGGLGSPTHLMYELLADAIPGIGAAHIPFKAAIEATGALLGGEIDFQFAIPSGAIEFIRNGKLRPLSCTGAKRLELLPDVPTTAEAGIPGFKAEPWGGFMVPARTSDSVVKVLAEAAFFAVNSPEVSLWINRMGGVKLPRHTSAEFSYEISKELVEQRAIVKRLGMIDG